MDIAFLIRQRLDELGIGQRDLAAAAEVTESYISQLLAKKSRDARKKLEFQQARPESHLEIEQDLEAPLFSITTVSYGIFGTRSISFRWLSKPDQTPQGSRSRLDAELDGKMLEISAGKYDRPPAAEVPI